LRFFALFSLVIASSLLDHNLYASLSSEGTIEIIAFIILPFKHVAILRSVDVGEPQSPVHHGFSFSFCAQQNQSCSEIVILRTDEE